LFEQLIDTETCLDRLSSQAKSAYIVVKEGQGVDEQEWEVQELISIMMNLMSFKFVFEKIQRNTDRNSRLIKRLEIKTIEASAG
jgi:hypothetical protein